MLVKRANMIEIECVARGYISGSGWKEYQQQGTVCGIQLPEGLRESDKLPEPIFTPATKAQSGHDENVSFEHVVSLIGEDLAKRLRDLTLEIYSRAARYAETKGIIIADTKFEFGFVGDELVLGDEVLTPDSSRFWPADTYKPGGPQFSFDKQFVRDYLESIRWNKQPPAPPLPQEVAAKTSEKYRQAYQHPHRPRTMNWLDIVLLVILAASVITSFRKGFSREVIGLVSVVLALFLGSWFYGTAGAFLLPYLSSRSMAMFGGFFLVFCRRDPAGYDCELLGREVSEGNGALVFRSHAGRGLRSGARLADRSGTGSGDDGVFAWRTGAAGCSELAACAVRRGCGARGFVHRSL